MYDNSRRAFSQFGQKVTITNTAQNTKQVTRAFIQPLRSDYQSPMYGDFTSKNEQFIYIGKPGVKLCQCDKENTIIESNSGNYKIIQAEDVYLSEKVFYERALLEPYTSS